MNYIGLVILALLIQVSAFSANIAMLISLNGEGTFSRAGKEQVLTVSQTFQKDDIISMKSGSAVLMYFSGNETILKKGTPYKVTESGTANSSLYAMGNAESSNALLSQSGNIYSIRGLKHVFPSKSKLSVNDTIFLLCRFDSSDTNTLTINLVESKMQKTVFSQSFTDSMLVIVSAPLEVGKMYNWSVTGTGQNIPELGTIAIVDSPIDSVYPKTQAEYIEAIYSNYANNFQSKALRICVEARRKFPETSIFGVMYENLLK